MQRHDILWAVNKKKITLSLLLTGIVFIVAMVAVNMYEPQDNPLVVTVAPSPSPEQSIVPDEVENHVNAYRTEHDLSELVRSETACSLANMRMDDIKKTGLDNHEGAKWLFDSVDGRQAENLQSGAITSWDVVYGSGWVASPEHNDLMLTTEFPYACAVTSFPYVVMVFSDR